MDLRGQPRYHRGVAYGQLGKLDLGVADLTRAIDLDPSEAIGYQDRGNLRIQQGEFDLAIADLTKAIELQPKATRALALRGFARARTGDAVGATTDFERARALTTDPNEIRFIETTRSLAGL